MSDNSPSRVNTDRFDSFVANAVDAILTFDKHGIIRSTNPATARLFGFQQRELLGQHVKMLLPDELHNRCDNFLAKQGGPASHRITGSRREVEGKRKDNTRFPMHFALSQAIVDGETAFTAIIRDISDLKRREVMLQAILDNAVDAIITIDDHGLMQDANPATETMFGYDARELRGQNVRMLMPSPYFEEHDGYLAHYLKTGEKKIIGVGREVVGLRKDGSTFPMHLAVSEVSVGDRRMFTGIVRDITDLKQVERRLEELNEDLEVRVRRRTEELRTAQRELVKAEKMATLGKVSGGIAHEIRNPLNAVKTSAFFLLNAKSPTAEKTKEHLERIDRQVTIIDNVVTALSDVARLPDAVLRPNHVADFVLAAMKEVSLPDNIRTSYSQADDVPAVMVDQHQIPMVIKNLIRNARDAMPEGGQLDIDVSLEGEHVHIDVRDEGVGIPPEDLVRVTEPLYSTKARGMGLGLAICLAILEKNSGSLEIESEVGKGSRFRIKLTAAKE